MRSLYLKPNRATHDMSNKLPFIGGSESARPLHLDCLREIVQEQSHEDEITIQPWIQRQCALSELKQIQRVLKQSTDPRMMDLHRSRCLSKIRHEPLIRQILLRKFAHRGMRQRAHDLKHARKHLIDVLLRARQQRTNLIRRDFRTLNGLKNELRDALIELHIAAHMHEANIHEVLILRLLKRPHPRRHLPRRIPQNALQKRLIRARRPQLRIHQRIHALNIRSIRQRRNSLMICSSSTHSL